MKRVLLTGATGFIGRHAIEPLVRRGFEVHGIISGVQAPATAQHGPLSNTVQHGPGSNTAQHGRRNNGHRTTQNNTGRHGEAARANLADVTWHRVDLLSQEGLGAVLEQVRPTHLLHFAWIATPGIFWTSPENATWVRASLELLEQFAAAGGRRVVIAGTCAEYDWTHGHCVEGLTPLAPATLYGTSKHMLRMTAETFAAQSGVSLAWGRIFFLYGPHEHPDRLVSSVILSLLRGERALCSAGTQVRDFMHVADVADAFAALLDSAVIGPVNIASGTAVPVKNVIAEIASQIGRPDLVRLGARPSNEVPVLTASVERLQVGVGWRPAETLTSGLAGTVAWWRERLHQTEG